MVAETIDVLIVEDNRGLRRAYSWTFKLDGGWEVRDCKSLEDGWKLFLHFRPRVVWLNPGSQEPGGTWEDYALRMKAEEGPPTRIIVVTGDPDVTIRQWCEAHDLGYVFKPLTTPTENVAAVTEALAKADAARAAWEETRNAR